MIDEGKVQAAMEKEEEEEDNKKGTRMKVRIRSEQKGQRGRAGAEDGGAWQSDRCRGWLAGWGEL